ncbi:electron transfer flavoprotein subunit beta/FixA family protein [Caldithrix abyssi]|uniref:Electron transfer flavoprotein subunit beta n=1 Tax=Caldithrix abyssi DSM 13497 TaxID=880073 RepID=H1XR44_CALAY|nr:electron transfer flavoprotein subunit beta/FixA family protein [Caldithrix abyssi]APF17044.1 electron transfer flavoprotein beta subunit [Caldithrix abyssi DSM 13497]EHO41195.1 Electron transfer flavoprotein alpha/beta-subunit [Caldithrix abyssi DSM 13497]
MNIAVCIKQTPDTEARIKLTEDRRRVDESDINFILNPYDEFAVEEAVKLKESNGGEVTVISLGPDRVTSAMRTALAMGADKAIHLKTDRHPDDPLVTAKALAEVLRVGNYDLIFLGKQAIDDDHNQMPSLLGSLLDMPAATVVIKLEIDGDRVVAEREVDGGHEVLEFNLPAIIGAQRGLNEPRYPSLKGIMRAKKIQIEERSVALEAEQLQVESYDYPPPKEAGKIVGDSADAVPELLRLLREEAKVL